MHLYRTVGSHLIVPSCGDDYSDLIFRGGVIKRSTSLNCLCAKTSDFPSAVSLAFVTV